MKERELQGVGNTPEEREKQDAEQNDRPVNKTFFWIDPQEEGGVIVLMHSWPFYDEAALRVLRGVEIRVYQHLRRSVS
jgi:hypothetical protein